MRGRMRFTLAALLVCIPALLCLAQTTSTCPAPAGTNLLSQAIWEYSTTDGKSWLPVPPVIHTDEKVIILARATFAVDNPAQYAALELTSGLPARQLAYFRLNGQIVPTPEVGMFYKTIPAIPPSMLASGTNTLEATIDFRNSAKMPDRTIELERSLVALRPDNLRFDLGPVLGYFDKDSFTVTCRLNMASAIRVLAVADSPASAPASQAAATAGQIVAEEGASVLHRLKIHRVPGVSQYVLQAQCGPATAELKVTAPVYPTGGSLRFVAMGDSRTFPTDWAKVAAAALAAKPQFIVYGGDAVPAGRNDWSWGEEFFGPCANLFAQIPFYPVIGNHEEGAALFHHIFYTPSENGTGTNWSQQIEQVLLIGIDGAADWRAKSPNLAWLEEKLKGSSAKFIFVFSHYPAWSSGGHGAGGEKPLEQARAFILPLLTRYKVTAFITGHDHQYERSELPGGLTEIITGGAGAPRNPLLKLNHKQNPYGWVLDNRMHYRLLEIQGNS